MFIGGSIEIIVSLICWKSSWNEKIQYLIHGVVKLIGWKTITFFSFVFYQSYDATEKITDKKVPSFFHFQNDTK